MLSFQPITKKLRKETKLLYRTREEEVVPPPPGFRWGGQLLPRNFGKQWSRILDVWKTFKGVSFNSQYDTGVIFSPMYFLFARSRRIQITHRPKKRQKNKSFLQTLIILGLAIWIIPCWVSFYNLFVRFDFILVFIRAFCCSQNLTILLRKKFFFEEKDKKLIYLGLCCSR